MYTVFQTHRTVDDWLAMQGRVLVSWAIMNPNGPTVGTLGYARSSDDSDQVEVFHRWLHFLGGESYCLGYIDADTEDFGGELVTIVRHALQLEAGAVLKRFPLMTCVPSFLFCLAGDEWVELYGSLFSETRAFREADWGRERYYVPKHGSDFFGRAAEEVRETLETMRRASDGSDAEYLHMIQLMHSGKPHFDNWRPGQYQSRPMQDGDVEHWLGAVSGDEFLVAALPQLAQMWVGASRRMGVSMPVKESFEDVRDFLEHFQQPFWPAEWTTESVARGMGLGVPQSTTQAAVSGQTPQPSKPAASVSLAERISRAVRDRFGSRARH